MIQPHAFSNKTISRTQAYIPCIQFTNVEREIKSNKNNYKYLLNEETSYLYKQNTVLPTVTRYLSCSNSYG